jgi:hypothetical protein
MLLSAAVQIAESNDFDSDEIANDRLPAWFLEISSGDSRSPGDDPIGHAGAQRYLAAREDRPWEASEWIYCFDPDLRAWSWWDATSDDRGTVNIWFDTMGEAHIPCEELWWAAYVAGAETVAPMTLESATVWRSQSSVGLWT